MTSLLRADRFQRLARVCLLSNAQAYALERSLAAQLPPHALMSRAGQAVARLARARFPHARRVLVLTGRGNNGGDGFVAAAHLQQAGLSVTLQMLEPPKESTHDAYWAYCHAVTAIDKSEIATYSLEYQSPKVDLIIDALLGAGLNRTPVGLAAHCISAINALCDQGVPVLSVDVPSGMNADTGHADGTAVRATLTLALLALKPGHFTGMAPHLCGELWFDDLGTQSAASHSGHAAQLNTAASLVLAPRNPLQHKGQSGDVIVVGGGVGMSGAPRLAARAALACGAGRVYVQALAAGDTAFADAAEPGLMQHLAATPWPTQACIVYGPGAGSSDAALHALQSAITHPGMLVLDADGLNLLSAHTHLQAQMMARAAGRSVITPHPAEAARLLGASTAEVQRHRIDVARQLATRYKTVAVLKGAGTVIADVDGRVAINPTGNARLATAGSGDVLAGVIAALAAQGLSAWQAACTGVYAHGAAVASDTEATAADVLMASHQPNQVAAALGQLRAIRDKSGLCHDWA
jgi:hydroxyethylthiazole kinase-like uncharacterized protein yjeF